VRWYIFGKNQLRTVKSIRVIHDLLAEFQLSCLRRVVQPAVFLLLCLQQDGGSFGRSHVTSHCSFTNTSGLSGNQLVFREVRSLLMHADSVLLLV